MLGTGPLTIARAIGRIFFLDEVWKVELEKIFRETKKKNIVGLEPMLIPLTKVELRKFSEKKKKEYCRIRTNAHSFDEPVQLPLAH